MPATEAQTAERRQYRVYVIKLDPKVLEKPGFRKANPQHDPRKSCVYVGSTGLSPEERFIQHKNGVNENPLARDYGIDLMRSLMARKKPCGTALVAIRQEAALARRLRKAGYAVWPTEESFQREIKKLEEKRAEKLAERARRRRERQREQQAARKTANKRQKAAAPA